MSVYIETDFYKASYLLSEGYSLQSIERADNRLQFHFPASELIAADLKCFGDNKKLSNFISAHKMMRSRVRNFNNRQKSAQRKVIQEKKAVDVTPDIIDLVENDSHA
jgi:hypothetical protein